MDTRLITYFTGAEVEVLRWVLERELDLVETLGYDRDYEPVIREILSRIP
jgi:hypothetical protein